ncbi:MAG: adenine phosphoribosyltransferase [Balneolales bacterium]|nr:adenine phosphoribosyltransferase [Balneolales bacterium]
MSGFDKICLEQLNSKIRDIKDFPKPGIIFKDITPLLRDPDTLYMTNRLLAKPFLKEKVDLIVGLESRGFLFGPSLAMRLDAGFVPIRKPNKLPAKTISASYKLEYGEDSVEIHADSIIKGNRVLIHDDLIATGGTAAAATELVERLGGEVVGYSFLINLSFLEGTKKLKNNVLFDALLTF